MNTPPSREGGYVNASERREQEQYKMTILIKFPFLFRNVLCCSEMTAVVWILFQKIVINHEIKVYGRQVSLLLAIINIMSTKISLIFLLLL